MFLKAMWHSLTVVSAGMFWLLLVLFTLGGLAQLGLQPLAGQICLGFVTVIVVVRIVLVPRFIRAPVYNVVGCGAFVALMVVLTKTGLTGLA